MEQTRRRREITLFPVTSQYAGIDDVADVVVLTHTVVGDDLRGVATRFDGTVDVAYVREDITAVSFGERVGGLPPVPNDSEFFSIGDEQHTLIWTAFEDGGLAIALEPDVDVSIPRFVEELRALGVE